MRYRRDEIAPTLSAVADAANTIQAMGQRNITFNQNQADRATDLQEKADIDANIKNLRTKNTAAVPESTPIGGNVPENSAGPPTSAPSAMQGSETSRIEATRRFKIALESEKQIAELLKDKTIQDGLKVQYAYLKENGLDNYLVKNFEGDHRANQQVRTILVNEVRKTEEAQSATKSQRFKSFSEQYKNVFHPIMTAVGAKIKNGDLEGAANSFMALSKGTQVGYELSDYDPKTGTLMKTYPASETGQHEPAGRVSVVELYETLGNWGKKEYVEVLDRTADATVESNALNRLNPIPMTGPKGKTYWLTSQKKVADPSVINYSIRVDGSREKQDFNNFEELQKAHPFIKREDLNRKKALADIALREQQEKTSEAAMSSHNQKKSSASSKAKRDALAKVMTEGAKFFGSSGSDILFNETGDLTTAGENARQEAFDFYDEHKENPNALNGTEYIKFNIAKAIVGSANSYFGVQPKQKPIPIKGAVAHEKFKSSFSIEEAQKMGAKQLPDGRWAVPSDIKGKAKVINVQQTEETSETPPPQPEAGKSLPSAMGQENIQSELPADSKQWKIRYKETGMNEGEYLILDNDGNERKLTEAEWQIFNDNNMPSQGEPAFPLRDLWSKLARPHPLQKNNQRPVAAK